MPKRLDVGKLFRDEADKLKKARDLCCDLHASDIRAAGNEVELSVRRFFEQMLPKRFCVTHGHLIDRNGAVSPQLDIIISDNTSIPSLLTTSDGTHYIPIESVYAVGEIKSTFSKGAIEAFARTLHSIREEMFRPPIENTFHGGLRDTTSIRDIFLSRPHKYLNPLFSFMVFVSGGNCDETALREPFATTSRKDLPAMTALLDKFIVCYGKVDGQRLSIEKYPSFVDTSECNWIALPGDGNSQAGSVEGNHLGMVYYWLLEHLNQTFLEPLDVYPYCTSMFVVKRSACKKLC